MKAFIFKITVKDIKPPLWRRIAVPMTDSFSFSDLHDIIQYIFGLDDAHLYCFKDKKKNIEIELYDEDGDLFDSDDDFFAAFPGVYPKGYRPPKKIDADTFLLTDYFPQSNSIIYNYDFGDDWEMNIKLEKIDENYNKEYPRVLKAKGNNLIEDCGGAYGYMEALEIYADPASAENKEFAEWLPPEDLLYFEIDDVNEALMADFTYEEE